MSPFLKHALLFTLVAASAGLTLAIVSQSSQAADHRDGPILRRFELDPDSTFTFFESKELEQVLGFQSKIPFPKTDGDKVDVVTEGLSARATGVNFKFPNKGDRPMLRFNARKAPLRKFKNEVRAISARTGANDARARATGVFPGVVRKGNRGRRPVKFRWKVTQKTSKIQILPRRLPRPDPPNGNR